MIAIIRVIAFAFFSMKSNYYRELQKFEYEKLFLYLYHLIQYLSKYLSNDTEKIVIACIFLSLNIGKFVKINFQYKSTRTIINSFSFCLKVISI